MQLDGTIELGKATVINKEIPRLHEALLAHSFFLFPSKE